MFGNKNWYDLYERQLDNIYKNHYNAPVRYHSTSTLKYYPGETAESAQNFHEGLFLFQHFYYVINLETI